MLYRKIYSWQTELISRISGFGHGKQQLLCNWKKLSAITKRLQIEHAMEPAAVSAMHGYKISSCHYTSYDISDIILGNKNYIELMNPTGFVTKLILFKWHFSLSLFSSPHSRKIFQHKSSDLCQWESKYSLCQQQQSEWKYSFQTRSSNVHVPALQQGLRNSGILNLLMSWIY